VLPKHMQGAVVARIKILSRLNIAERRLPQDGHFKLELEDRHVDIRVSTLPTLYGEKVVMRILDTMQAVLDIDRLGFDPENKRRFLYLLRHTHGVCLITGPTGSGKTTTLYGALQYLNKDDVNIITIEDPIEYQLTGINQVQVNLQAGLTFARGLRAILRQDPNIVMVGEIRDTETAEIAIRAALTGHLVFSTLHTNDAVAAITRLVDMGVEPFLVSSALVGVVAQRLVRRICLECAEPYEPQSLEKEVLVQKGIPLSGFKRGKGCNACHGTGYFGRMAIQEVFVVDDEIRRMILDKRSDAEYRRHARSLGMKSMLEDGIEKARRGLTTLSEVLRVTLLE
jgi:type IV pilus assembly protein PilB